MLNTNEKVKVAQVILANGETMGVSLSESGEVILTPEMERLMARKNLEAKVFDKVELPNGFEFGFTSEVEQIFYHAETGQHYVVDECCAKEFDFFKERFIQSAISSAFKAGTITIVDDKYLRFNGGLLVSQRLLNTNGQTYAVKELSTEAREKISKRNSAFSKGLALSYDCLDEICNHVADHISAYDLLYLYKESTEHYLDWVQQIQERKAQ
ncbi:TPA: hypothetical protein ROY42_005638 [Bacillus thuringiensis]|nr:hypothetical protein [Bacillus thuringiensis]